MEEEAMVKPNNSNKPNFNSNSDRPGKNQLFIPSGFGNN
jgi:hypothetical protein